MNQKQRKQYGKKVRTARLAKELSQRGLAELLGVSQPTVCMVETGYAAPGPKLIKSIASTLKVKP